MLRSPIIVAALVLGWAPLLAEFQQAVVSEPVEGAFGLRLGATFTPDEAVQSATTVNGAPAYFFSPSAQSRLFDFYLVQITPKSHRIHTIMAVARHADIGSCERDRGMLMSMLKDKYGASTDRRTARNHPFAVSYEIIAQGDRKRAIGVGCAGGPQVNLQAIYLDENLADLAQQERGRLAHMTQGQFAL